MKGTVRKRKYRSGRISWCYEIDAPRDGAQERVRITRSGFSTQRAALEALSKEVALYSEGKYVRRSRQTLAAYLETWLAEHADRNLVAKTAERYRELIEKYIAPRIGHVPLQELDPFQLERMYADLRQKGGLRVGKPLSPRTVQQIHAVINSALNKAVRWKQLVVNPAKACELPKREHRDVITPDQSDTKLILESLKSTELYLVALIAAQTGMRRGEILALAWACIDFDANVIKVSRSLQETRAGLSFKSPKNRKPREFPFSSVLRTALLEHRRRQETTVSYSAPTIAPNWIWWFAKRTELR